MIGVIVCKLEPHRGGPMRGYIAMLATREEDRGQGIAGKLVRLAIDKMIEKDADEIALETEVDNIPSLRIYENLGFIRTKRLHRYYLNGNTAFRLILYLKPGIPYQSTYPPDYGMETGEEAYYGANAGREGEEDSIERRAAQMKIEDVHGEHYDVRGSSL
ncbi:related to N-acetyltransferase [Ramularia collo-cygni]|uniref:Related to N-acetyltransferase n=1 Tax=Ramularia collo-cygni TaxID=112498 RepID=A0A2D3UN04_9PEZI|nr:related to N-acetyltransferase [Ramularia collo-cygni]CZT14488.1 related to N-acetyltransferase [Ramularia collo-cygni]